MEQILQNIKEILGVPAFLINQCPILPQYIKLALIDSINFIPWLYILYYGIELLERFFLTHIEIFVKFSLYNQIHYLLRDHIAHDISKFDL